MKWFNSLSVVVVISLTLTACGGGGDGGTGGSPPTTAQTTVSGTVQAPNGQVAFHQPTFWDVFESSAFASLSGLTAVPDGTPVQLGRMSSAGSFTVLASTTVSGGRYSFNLTSLGLSITSDLVVRVANGAAQMRAFVTRDTADLNPISESAVQFVLDHIAATPGTSLTNFTTQELSDLAGAIDALTAANQSAAGGDINTTIASIKTAASNEPGIAAFLVSAGGPGQTVEGTGDIGNYVPLAQNNTWSFQGTDTTTGQTPITYSNTATISGTKLVGGVVTTVLSETNPLNDGAEESYLTKDGRGLTFHGNNDLTDFVTPQLVPYLTLRFPFGTGSTFEEIKRKGLDFGQDLDGDGTNEKANLVSIVTVRGFESVLVPAGTFSNCATVETRATVTVIASSNGAKLTEEATQTMWFAPGVGPVKLVSQIGSQTWTEELTSFTTVAPTILTIGSPLPSHVEKNTESSYSLDVVPGTAYTVSITGLTDIANLRVLGGINECTTSSLDAPPKDCTVTASGSVLNITVDGHQVIGSAADYVITAILAPIVTLPITGTEGSVPRGIPTLGLVGTRQTSRYFTTGLTPGTHTVSITGLTGDADLHVFSDDTYSFELDCTLRRPSDVTNGPEDCTLVTGTALYFSVASGELNRDGAGYIILVW